jgi:glycosyltransferase involved in cell wall biosynthesis
MKQHIVFTESSPNVGGQELQCMQQMQALMDQGYACTLACRAGGRVESSAQEKGLDTTPIAFRNSVHLPSILGLRSLIVRTRAAMVICHSGHDANNAAIACRLVRHRPYLLRSRTYLTDGQKPCSYNHLVDDTMVPSRFVKTSLEADPRIDGSKIHVIYPGIDFARIDAEAALPLPATIERWLACSDTPLLVHAAMLRAEKGHDLMLQVVARLQSRWPGLRYLMAGEGVERAALEARIQELGLSKQVLLAGNVSPIHALYPRADLVVMPSTTLLSKLRIWKNVL